MINTKKRVLRLRSAIAAILVLCFTASCNTDEDKTKDDDGTPDKVTTVSVVPATPGVGIGRVVNEPAESNGIVIGIDPGHGFMDGGAGEGILPDGILEKDINLSIANKLNEDLMQLGYTTILTHDGVNLPPEAMYDHIFNAVERSAYVNSLKMDYFISIHVNSAQNSEAEGSRIYYYDNSIKVNPIGGAVAELIGEAIEKNIPEDVDPVVVDQSEAPNSSFALCRDVKYPSALVEVGFCTNENDAAKMIDDEWQERFAQALADGIDEYFTNHAK